jgi:heme/copper-type cytochrome/quinol oxidase subunit 3
MSSVASVSATPAPRVRQSTRVATGKLGMWWFLASEVVTFGGIVVTYVLLRLTHPEWLKHSSQTLLPIGAANTVVLLTSSLTMVLAHAAAQQRDAIKAKRYLLITLALGVLFLCFKGYEYHHEIHEGLTPAAGVFWGFYFAMTGLHGLHVVAGLIAMIAVTASLKQGKYSRVEVLGLYWHFVDVVWIFLFPLLYVTAQG